VANRALPLIVAAAICSVAGTTRAQDAQLVGKRVAVDVGDVVNLPSGAAGADPRETRDAIIAGAHFTEVRAAGQDSPLLVPAPNTRVEGNLVAVDDDVLKVRLHSGPQVITIARAAVSSLQIRQRRSQAGKGFWFGTGVGLVTGLGLVIASHAAHSCYDEECTAFDSVTVGALAIGGGVVGAVAGGMTHAESWERVDPRRLSIAVMPDPRRGIRGRLAVRF
jgi:hypothetical protein